MDVKNQIKQTNKTICHKDLCFCLFLSGCFTQVICNSDHDLFSLLISDLFEKIVPIPVYDAMNVFEGRKSQITNMEIGRLREQTTLMNGYYIYGFLTLFIRDTGKQVL